MPTQPSRRTRKVDLATELVRESQIHGESLIRLSEYSTSASLTELQKKILIAQGEKLEFLGLKLIPQIPDKVFLKASQSVGATRFIHEKSELIVQVEPKIGNANFLKMLDHVYGSIQEDSQQTAVSTEQTSPVGLFLEYFAARVLQFLHRSRYRSYSFATSSGVGNVKGRPLVKDYLSHSLPKAKPDALPCRYLEFTADVMENQIIAYAVHVALQLASLIESDRRTDLVSRLRVCARLMPGVTVRRLTTTDVNSVRYNRTNRPFEPIHKLCEVVIRRASISLKPGQRIPFLSFATDMARLFERYVGAAFKAAFRENFVGDKSLLTFPLHAFGKSIVLDGLLDYQDNRFVVECKYKDISPKDGGRDEVETDEGFAVLGGRIKGNDLYQAAAYSGHVEIQAHASLILYPSDVDERSHISVAGVIDSFGWRRDVKLGTPIFLLNVNLAAPFAKLVEGIKVTLDNVADELSHVRLK